MKYIRRKVCLDFDGVIHKNTSPFISRKHIQDGPIDGAREAIQELMQYLRVVIHSGRCVDADARQEIREWLNRYDIHVDEVCEHKPHALVYVDDRAVLFNGDWKQTMKKIKTFRQWQRYR